MDDLQPALLRPVVRHATRNRTGDRLGDETATRSEFGQQPEINVPAAFSSHFWVVSFRLPTRSYMSDDAIMKPAELLRRLKRLAAKRGWDLEIKEGGPHTKVWLQGRRSSVSRHPSDLKKGTYEAILKQLGVSETDLND